MPEMFETCKITFYYRCTNKECLHKKKVKKPAEEYNTQEKCPKCNSKMERTF